MGDIPFIVDALRSVGYCLFAQGEFEQARAYFEDSLAFGDPAQQGSQPWSAHGLMHLSELHLDLGDYRTARALFDEAPMKTAAHDDVRSERYTMWLSGRLARAEGDWRAALDFHRTALSKTVTRREVLRCLEAFATSLNDYGERRSIEDAKSRALEIAAALLGLTKEAT
jgi:tetratricopeptide (TPR) repeat protein